MQARRVRQPEPLCNAGGHPDRPVGARRDQPADVLGARQPVDRRLVLRGDDRPLGGKREAGSVGVAVDGDHQHPPVASGREQAQLRRTGA